MAAPVRRFEQCDKAAQAKLFTLWHKGHLAPWKCHSEQKRDLRKADALRKKPLPAEPQDADYLSRRTFFFDCARRYGKDFAFLTRAAEICRTRKGAMLRYGASTLDSVREIIMPLADIVSADCPPELRPYWYKGDWFFPQTESRVIVAGLDKQRNRLRGSWMDGCFLTEVGFFQDPEYMLRSVLIPQMQHRPHAFIWCGSTPAESPSHPWKELVIAAKRNGNCVSHTIWDNPLLTEEEVREFIALAGGPESTTCRREYFVEHVTDTERAVVPEFLQHQSAVVRELERPSHFDCYTVSDPGFLDLWGSLFCYWHFAKQTLVIEDELTVERVTTADFASALRAKEQALWPSKAPYQRISDNDLQVICDLSNLYALPYVPARKDNKQAAIAEMRRWIQLGKIAIHPRCEGLIAQLAGGLWAKSMKDYERSGTLGHLDLLDCLVYAVRHVVQSRNPFPAALPKEDRMQPRRALHRYTHPLANAIGTRFTG